MKETDTDIRVNGLMLKFPECLRNQLISVGSEQVLSHNENLSTRLEKFFTKNKINASFVVLGFRPIETNKTIN